MEQSPEQHTNSIYPLYRTLEDHRKGMLTFEELRKVYVAWALKVIESSTPEGNKLARINTMVTIPQE